MAVNTSPQHHKLNDLVQQWEARFRTRRLILNLPRVLIFVLFAAILVTVILRFLVGLSQETTAIMVGIVIGAVTVGVGSYLRLFGKQGIEAARRFDELFETQDRIATAVELTQGTIRTLPQLAEAQIADTYDVIRDIDPREKLKYKVEWLEIVGLVALSILLVLIISIRMPADDTNRLSPASQAALANAAEDVRDMTDDVATDTTLTDEERETLLESLEMSLDDLQRDDTSPEDAFVDMSNLESELRDFSDEIRRDLDAQNNTLNEAASALNDVTDTPPTDGGSGAENLEQQLSQIAAQLENLTDEQRQALIEAMEQAAQDAEGASEGFDMSMQEMLDALRDGANEETQQAIDEALQELQEMQEEMQEREQAADNLDDAADDAQDAAQEIAEAEQQDGEQQQGQQQEGEQEGQQGQGEQSDEGEGENQQGSNAVLGQGENQSDQAMQSENESEDTNSGSEALAQSNESGGGAGTGEGGKDDTIQQAGDIGSNNAELSDEERQYEAIFPPRDIAAEGSSTLELDVDDSNAPAVEGDFTENPTGESRIPYNQVFGSYQDQANHALENEYVPLGMRDVVRDYFTSLEPE